MKQKIGKILLAIIGMRASVVYMALFAIAIGVATFVENDFGTDAAQKYIYSARWFELLLMLFAVALIQNIRQYRFIQRKKWSLLMFHAAIVIIIFGAGVTRYFGFEGVMPIRKGQTTNAFLSAKAYVNIEIVKDGQTYQVSEPVLFSSLGTNSFSESYRVGSSDIQLELRDFIPNPEEKVDQKSGGVPALNIVIGTPAGRKEYTLLKGEQKVVEGQFFNFTNSFVPNNVNVFYEKDSFLVVSDRPMTQMIMATQENDTLLAGEKYPLQTRSLYQSESHQFVVASTFFAGKKEWISTGMKLESGSSVALEMAVMAEGKEITQHVIGQKGNEGNLTEFQFKNTVVRVSYGAKILQLPFSLKLNYFKMTRYPGTNSPESFLSNVKLIDAEKGIDEKHDIYMNHILDHRGYRFFQSSYDQDEEGTYLSVNHDFIGTWISYMGYFLLALGMFMTLFSKATRFADLREKIRNIRSTTVLLLCFIFGAPSVFSQTEIKPKLNMVQTIHTDVFNRIQVQDVRGRMKPMHTLTREIMRKVYGSESYDGYNADQVVLSMYINNNEWVSIPFIKLGKEEVIRKRLGVAGEYAAYKDFFNAKGEYKWAKEINAINLKAEKDRNVQDKLYLAIDERVNIMNMVLSGVVFRIVPVENDPNNTWVSNHTHGEEHHSEIGNQFFEVYVHELRHDLEEGNYTKSNKLIGDLDAYQRKVSDDIMLTENQVAVEILLNKSQIFNRLTLVYILLGLSFLVFLFLQIFKPNLQLKKLILSAKWLLYVFVGLHTLGLLARWYVSGHAPWSNGYESMIYIAWTSSLAGIIFTRKTIGGLAATNILAGVVLLIALLSYMNPEITPLVPVLKSYWLTIHVSMEAGSYGFLMLGAVIGILNLIIVSTINQNRLEGSMRVVKELSYVSEITLIGGLFMLSIGTFLGGIWANESWGRYWGWDAKETWALVSILVYAVILHLRLIPKANGIVLFNLMTIFGLASIIMTYYGVNYYLSGLHSYAAGDPAPMPSWVYYAVISVVILAILAFYKKKKYKIQ